MGSGKDERARRVVYQWSFKRSKRDDKAINAQIARAEKVAAGKAPLAPDPVPEGHRRHARNWTRPPSTGPGSWPA